MVPAITLLVIINIFLVATVRWIHLDYQDLKTKYLDLSSIIDNINAKNAKISNHVDEIFGKLYYNTSDRILKVREPEVDLPREDTPSKSSHLKLIK